MKKVLSIILICVLALSTMVIPVSADEIYYPCYIGTWTNTDSGNPVNIEVYSVSGNSMDFYFQYGQFAVTMYNAKIDGQKVYGKYHEVWDGGDFIVDGTVTLTLYDTGIWADWHSYENGRDGGESGYMFKSSNFKYTTIKDTDVKVVLNGEQLSFDQNPVILNDRVLVPIRAISENLGAEVSWDDVRKIGRIVGITKGNRYVGFCVDDTGYNKRYSPLYMMIRNGDNEETFVALDAPVIIYNDRTLVPVRAVSEAFDANVLWDGDTRTVSISSGSNKQTANNLSNKIDYSSYKGVWQRFTRIDADTPETELVINSISGNQVNFDILMYRLAGYYNQTATINSNGVIPFDTIENEHSNAPIHGTIKLSDNKVVLTITSSEFGYISPQTIEFDTKSTSSRLK